MAIFFGLVIYFVARCILSGFFTIDQNERGVKTIFGRAQRLEGQTTSSAPVSEFLNDEEKARYNFPLIESIGPGLHFKLQLKL